MSICYCALTALSSKLVWLDYAQFPIALLISFLNAHNADGSFLFYTGIKGWFPIYLPSDSSVHDASPHSYAEKVVGGLQLSVSFSDAEDRDHVIHVSRGVGWSPPAGVECDDDWLDKETMSKERHWEFCLKISKAWIPPTELQSLSSGAAKVDKGEKAYTRYKLYNKGMCLR